ncbi:hypothetical protein OHA72_40715 [Dactylosporangium sp. NBC_01737]|uniref:hypothetical protein n=1 Tax=Dactylosporangium sp. NBC_01737 TaxID=2975959 RepID=UPI002E1227F2|nr:hypothetical protein OHA72_40715 [Dactylosporangium sp. NBC_01737]
MRSRTGVACFLGAAALAAGGCGGGSAGSDGPAGTVHGTIVQSGGPRGASPGGAPGTVIVRRGGAEVGRQDVAEGKEFTFSLSPGRYRLSVQGVNGACVDADITVTASSDQSVELLCQRK